MDKLINSATGATNKVYSNHLEAFMDIVNKENEFFRRTFWTVEKKDVYDSINDRVCEGVVISREINYDTIEFKFDADGNYLI